MDNSAAEHYRVIAHRWAGHTIHVVSQREHAVSAVIDGTLFVRSGTQAARIGAVWSHFETNGVPVPELVTVAGPLVIARFIAGGSDPVRAGALAGLGRTVAKLHQVTPPEDWVTHGYTADRWDRGFANQLVSGLPMGVKRDLTDWHPAITAELETPSPDGWPTRCCVHGDLFCNNSLALPDGQDPVLVDFEVSGYGSPLYDLGHVVADLAIRCAVGAIDRPAATQAWNQFCFGYGRSVDTSVTRWRNPYLRTIPWLAKSGASSEHLGARLRDWLGVDGDLVALATKLADRDPTDPPW